MIICHLRYRLDVARLAEFREYGRIWVDLIEQHGGKHYGYFLAREAGDLAAFSFPGLGRAGAPDAGFALFSFPSREAYDRYREQVREHPDCAAAERLLAESGCVLEYERTFVERIA